MRKFFSMVQFVGLDMNEFPVPNLMPKKVVEKLNRILDFLFYK